MIDKLREHEGNLSSSLVSAVEKLSWEFSTSKKLCPTPHQDGPVSSAIRSKFHFAQEKGYTRWGTLWFYLCDDGEYMKKWDGKPTSTLVEWVRELQGKTIAQGSFSRRTAAPVSSKQFPRQRSRIANFPSDLNRDICDSHLQEASDKYYDQD